MKIKKGESFEGIEIGDRVQQNVSIDWSIKESVRARKKVIVKRLLRQYGYPPDKAAIATETVLKQAELFTEDWVNKIIINSVVN